MDIRIQSPHFTVNSALNDFVNEKVGALSRFDHKIMAAEVALKLDNSSVNENKRCEIKLVVPGNDMFAERQCSTFEEAVAQSVHALHNQISKKRD